MSPRDGGQPNAAGSLTIGERIDRLAADHPTSIAVVAIDRGPCEQLLTWRDLSEASDRAASNLADAGVDAKSIVGISLRNEIDHLFAAIGAWKLGAMVLPLDPDVPEAEARAIRATARPTLVVGRGVDDQLHPAALKGSRREILRRPGVNPRSASSTGGSTGAPRIVVRNRDWVYRPDQLPSDGDRAIGLRLAQVQLVMLPLHHSGFTALYHGLALGHRSVLMERFDPRRFADLVERHRINVIRVVPAMMRSILAVPGIHDRDLSSIEAVHQGGSLSAPAVKRAWLDLIGADKVYEGYSSQERIGAVWIRGDEWLRKPGSTGRPENCEVRVFDDLGAPVRTGEVGEIYIRSSFAVQPRYLGPGPPLPERDGFFSLGDMGYLDEDGYLFIVDRRADMINVGGTNVYPAEVESVLLERSDVSDVAVVGMAHEHLGKVPCAFIVAAREERPPDRTDLHRHCRERLDLAKVPLKYVFVKSLPRSASGKIRRRELQDSLA